MSAAAAVNKSRSGRRVKVPKRFRPGQNGPTLQEEEQEDHDVEDNERHRRRHKQGNEEESSLLLLEETREQTRLLRLLVRKADKLESVLCDVQEELAKLGVIKKPVPVSLQASAEEIPVNLAPEPVVAVATPVVEEKSDPKPSPEIMARLNSICSDLINKNEAN